METIVERSSLGNSVIGNLEGNYAPLSEGNDVPVSKTLHTVHTVESQVHPAEAYVWEVQQEMMHQLHRRTIKWRRQSNRP